MELVYIGMGLALVVALGNLISWAVICVLFPEDEKGE